MRRLFLRSRPALGLFKPALLIALGLLCGCDRAPAPLFNDVTAAVGLEHRTSTFSSGWVDVDGDGEPELYVGNHRQAPSLYVWQSGRYVEEAPDLGLFPPFSVLGQYVGGAALPNGVHLAHGEGLFDGWELTAGAKVPDTARIELHTQTRFHDVRPPAKAEDGGQHLTYTGKELKASAVRFRLYSVGDIFEMVVESNAQPPPSLTIGTGTVPVPTPFFAQIADRHDAIWADFAGDRALDLYATNGANRRLSLGLKRDFLLVREGDRFRESVDVEPGGVFNPSGSGRGAAAVDVDGDGRPEILVANYKTPNVAYRRGPDGQWREVGADIGWRIAEKGENQTVHPADFDGDGRTDLFVTGRPGFLLHNDGGSFVRVPALDRLEAGGGRCRGAAWGDVDGDGDLDLLVIRGPRLKDGVWQVGDEVWFKQDAVPVDGARVQFRASGPIEVDLYRDGNRHREGFYAGGPPDDRLPIRRHGQAYVGPDPETGAWLRVDGDTWTLSWKGKGHSFSGRIRPIQGAVHGVTVRAITRHGDRPGWLERWTVALGAGRHPCRLYENLGNGQFRDASREWRVDFTARDAAWVDVDGDRDLDLVVVRASTDGAGPPVDLYLNDGSRLRRRPGAFSPPPPCPLDADHVAIDARPGRLRLFCTFGYGLNPPVNQGPYRLYERRR